MSIVATCKKHPLIEVDGLGARKMTPLGERRRKFGTKVFLLHEDRRRRRRRSRPKWLQRSFARQRRRKEEYLFNLDRPQTGPKITLVNRDRY